MYRLHPHSTILMYEAGWLENIDIGNCLKNQEKIRFHLFYNFIRFHQHGYLHLSIPVFSVLKLWRLAGVADFLPYWLFLRLIGVIISILIHGWYAIGYCSRYLANLSLYSGLLTLE